MKIRLIGPTDIVRGWATKLREEYGIEGREYPSRHSPNEIRYYLDVDDRRAAQAYTGPEYQPPDSAGKHGHLATTKEDWGYWYHAHPVFGPEEPDTYPMPPDGWVCFHCGERFTTPGSAQDHFGERPEDTAACRIKVGEERGLVMELRRNQRINRWLLEELRSPSEPCAACGLRWYEGCGH